MPISTTEGGSESHAEVISVFVVILFLTNILSPVVTASQKNLDNSRPKLQDVPELDFTDLNTDMELIEIDTIIHFSLKNISKNI